ncbi:MAG: aspartyl protease [Elusimicrobiota bacterium]
MGHIGIEVEISNIEKGRAMISIQGKEEPQPIWISDIIVKVLIGTTTLQMLGFKVNPITEKIEETQLMLY